MFDVSKAPVCTRSGMPALPSAHAHNDVVENITVSLHYWNHACDETLDGQAAQLAAYFCRLHCVFHLTVHVGVYIYILKCSLRYAL